jgi:ATP phosphoribosyltransferase regulatory subunit
MTKVDRWLLPEGIEEVLPNQAFAVESLRRNLLDYFHNWGYDLVIPPLVEFTDSLLSSAGKDLDMLTFKLTDQLSGKAMGVRADVTPQTARMDAHSLQRQGPNRLCYASTVLYTRPRHALATRSPIQVGIELYGVAGLEADLEVTSLLAESLMQSGVEDLCLDLGHVGIFRAIEEELNIDDALKNELFALLQSKSCELTGWVEHHITDTEIAGMLRGLPALAGSVDVLDTARAFFANAPAEVELALDELQVVVDGLQRECPQLQIYLDLCELEGYHYHSGIVFAAYADKARQALANGGRYDDVGEIYGRARPATGFSIDLKALAELVANGHSEKGIYADPSDNPAYLQFVKSLRQRGERVVVGFTELEPDFGELGCDRRIVEQNQTFSVKPI